MSAEKETPSDGAFSFHAAVRDRSLRSPSRVSYVTPERSGLYFRSRLGSDLPPGGGNADETWMPRRKFASEKALKQHAELNGDFYAWESTATYAKWQRLLSRDQYEIVDVPTSQGVKRAMLFPKAILKAEWESDGPLREALGLNRGRLHEKSRPTR